jgi:PAS domain S-box-containing protein
MPEKPTCEELEQRIKQLEEAEERREELLEKLQRIANVGSWVLDHGTGHLHWSDETYRILGAAPQSFDASYEAFLDLVHPDERSAVDEAYRNSLQAGIDTYEIEHRIMRRNSGEIRHVLEKCDHERNDEGEIRRSIGIVQDITERKLAEAALVEREERYRFLAENMEDVIWTLDMDLRPTYVSPSIEKVLGFTPEERKKQKLSEILTPTSLERMYAVYAEELPRQEAQTAGNEGSVIIELEYYHRDGSTLWMENIVKPQRDENGRIVGVYGVSQDISRRKREKDALRTMAEMLDNAPSSITVHDKSGGFLYANEKTFEIHGWEPEEFLAMNLSDLDVPESAHLVKERLRRISEEGEVRFEVAHYRKDGSTFPLEVLAKTIHWNGKPAILSVADDISGRKRSEASMQALLEQQEAVLESSMVGIALVHNRIITKVNRRMAEMLGYTPEEIEGRSPEMLHLCQENFVSFGEKYYWRLGEETILQVEYPMRHKNGNTVWCLFSGRAVSPPDLGHGAVWVIDDITERKRTEEALRESEEKYRNLFENAPIGVFRTHSSGTVVQVNSTMARILGFDSPRKVVGHYQDLGTELFVHPERRAELLAQLKENGFVENFEYAAKTRSGEPIWVSLTARKIPDGSEDSFLIEGFSMDITQRKKAEEEKRLLEEQFHQVQKMESIGRLAGGVAHDLNNLLSPILGYGEMLLEDASAHDPRRDSLEEIFRAGKRGQALVRQLLAFSRKQPLHFQPLDLNELVKGFQKLIRRTLREDIEIGFRLDPSIPRIKGDLGQIEQVIMNLAVNAQDAMPQGGNLQIETAPAEIDEAYAGQKRGVKPGRYAMLAISDTGFGMNSSTLAQLFEPFFTTKEKGKGTGLGMSTAYGIAKQHGGNIWAYSEPGLGTTIKVYLPAEGAAADEKEATAAQNTAKNRGTATILLAEDDSQVRNLAASILKREGYTVLVAENAGEGLAMGGGFGGDIDLLLTDVIMPDMNGKELFERLSPAQPRMRVLYMSGYTDDVIAHHGVIDEGVNFIEKPFTVHALVAKIAEILAS